MSMSSPSHQDVLEAKCEPVEDIPPQGELGLLSVSSLRRSVSQLMDVKSVGDEDVWDPNTSGHDSGMVRDPKDDCWHQSLSPHLLLQFMDDEEFVDTVKGFSTVRKEHTMFTDTNL